MLDKLRLHNNVLANVRIMRIEERDFFIPQDWTDPLAARRIVAGQEIVDPVSFGRFVPDINAVECPGTIHERNPTDTLSSVTFRLTDQRRESAVSNIAVTSRVGIITLWPSSLAETDKLTNWPPGTDTTAWVVVIPKKLWVMYRWPRSAAFGSTKWQAERAEVIGLLEWLMTPPRDRDDQRILELGNASS